MCSWLRTVRYFSCLAGIALLALLVASCTSEKEYKEYADYVDKQMGFSLSVPKAWLPPVKKSVATLVFSGPKGTEQYQTTINVQLVKKPGDTLQTQMQELEKQWAATPRYRLWSRQAGTLCGQRGVRLVAEYQLPGGNEMFKQEQFIADRSPYFFWVAYTAPVALFDKYQPVMVKVVDSLNFLPLQVQAAPAQPPSQPPVSPAAPSARIYDLKPCKKIDGTGKPVGVSQVFPPDVGRIHVWFRFRDIPVGTEIRSEWFFGKPGAMQKATEASTKVQSASDWGQFNLGMSAGGLFPVADYRVDIYLGQKKEASVTFQVKGQ